MILVCLLFSVVLALLVWVRLLTVAAYFQQEEYDNGRFVRAWPKLSLIDVKVSLTAVVVVTFGQLFHWYEPMAMLMTLCGAALVVALLERHSWKTMKKRLGLTGRVKRLVVIAALLLLCCYVLMIAALAPLSMVPSVFAAILVLQMVPASLIAANVLLQPYQERENNRYITQAREKLSRYTGVRIGITGSFGKTTVKHILGDVLGQLSTVFYSKGSINTVLGHTRHIRHRLQPAHRYFVAEMGAYGQGSVQRLCELIDPNHAIITSIGLAHNERFGGLEVVAKAKSELAAWVAARGGRVVMTQDVAGYAPFQRIISQYPGQSVVVGSETTQTADYRISHVETGLAGTNIKLTRDRDGYSLDLSLPLLGQHNRDNLALISALLLELEWQGDAIKAALGGVRHVPHRLAPRAGPNGSTILDDAYNANPVGMANAMALAQKMAANTGGKAVIITPGLVELGDKHDDEHHRLGRLAGSQLSKSIIVTPERIPSFVEGVKAAGGTVETAESYLAAREEIDPELTEGDVLLIANDLPDLLGRRVWL